MAAKLLAKEFLENRDALLGFLFALTRDIDVAEEIFQETALVIMEEAGKQTQVASFMAWAREIARRRLKEYYRKQARNTASLPAESLVEIVDQAFLEADAVESDNAVRIRYLIMCIEKLADRSRQVIEGFYRQKKSIREIARDLSWEENSVKVALSRARKVLADCVQLRLREQGS